MSLLDTAERHRLTIAWQTLKMHDVGALIMGGPTKEEARATLRRHHWSERDIAKLEGKLVDKPKKELDP